MSRVSSLIKKVFGPPKAPAPAVKKEEPTALGMTMPTEHKFCRDYARNLYTGQGEIADLGCWMGATSISFARGLKSNPNIPKEKRAKRIHSYDLFLWHPTMDYEVKGTELEGKFKDGESFLPEFKARTEKYEPQIAVYAGDINDHGWDGRPIEMLFVDAMKWPDTAQTILRKFYPYLVPGLSLVSHQDFAHFFTGWVHLIQYRLREYFSVHSEVPRACTVTFKLEKAIPPELLQMDAFLTSATREELDAAFDWAASIVSEEKQEQIAAARAMAHVHRGELDEVPGIAKEFFWKHMNGFLYHKLFLGFERVKDAYDTAKAGLPPK